LGVSFAATLCAILIEEGKAINCFVMQEYQEVGDSAAKPSLRVEDFR
jgi:hypothetical protein